MNLWIILWVGGESLARDHLSLSLLWLLVYNGHTGVLSTVAEFFPSLPPPLSQWLLTCMYTPAKWIQAVSLFNSYSGCSYHLHFLALNLHSNEVYIQMLKIFCLMQFENGNVSLGWTLTLQEWCQGLHSQEIIITSNMFSCKIIYKL